MKNTVCRAWILPFLDRLGDPGQTGRWWPTTETLCDSQSRRTPAAEPSIRTGSLSASLPQGRWCQPLARTKRFRGASRPNALPEQINGVNGWMKRCAFSLLGMQISVTSLDNLLHSLQEEKQRGVFLLCFHAPRLRARCLSVVKLTPASQRVVRADG